MSSIGPYFKGESNPSLRSTKEFIRHCTASAYQEYIPLETKRHDLVDL